MPAVAALLFGAFAILYFGDRQVYLAVLRAINENPFPAPFLDTRFVTAQVECWQRGIDVYATNPCDPLGRTQDYSPLWLRLGFLGRPDGSTPVFGLAIDLLFLASLFAMPWRRGENLFGSVVATGAVVSWASAFALARGNTDLLMFAAAVAFAHLLTRSGRARAAGYALVLGAGLLKFYPLPLLGLLVRETSRRMWLGGIACALVLLLFALRFHDELARIGANMATGVFGAMFGARTVPFGVVDLWRIAHGMPDAEAMPPNVAGWALLAAMTAGCVAQASVMGRDQALRFMLAQLPPRVKSLLLVGAVLCVGCFFGHQNIGYRSVMLLLVVPGLLALVRLATAGRLAISLRATSVLLVLAMWGGDIEGSFVGWFAIQLAWWWITCVLLAILFAELAPAIAAHSRRSRATARTIAPAANTNGAPGSRSAAGTLVNMKNSPAVSGGATTAVSPSTVVSTPCISPWLVSSPACDTIARTDGPASPPSPISTIAGATAQPAIAKASVA